MTQQSWDYILISEEFASWLIDTESPQVQRMRAINGSCLDEGSPALVVATEAVFAAIAAHRKAKKIFPRENVSLGLERQDSSVMFYISFVSPSRLTSSSNATRSRWDAMVREYIGYLLSNKKLAWFYGGRDPRLIAASPKHGRPESYEQPKPPPKTTLTATAPKVLKSKPMQNHQAHPPKPKPRQEYIVNDESIDAQETDRPEVSSEQQSGCLVFILLLLVISIIAFLVLALIGDGKTRPQAQPKVLEPAVQEKTHAVPTVPKPTFSTTVKPTTSAPANAGIQKNKQNTIKQIHQPKTKHAWPKITFSEVRNGAAILNGKAVLEGKSISGVTLEWFTDDKCMLSYKGERFVLRIGQSIPGR